MKEKEQLPACFDCNGMCCRYVALQIDTPDCRRDYDHIRWYLLHEKVYVFVEHGGDWYVEFETPCGELDDASRCLIYENRPRICRRHGSDDVAECEFVSDEDAYAQRFSTAAELEEYLDGKGIKWRPKKGKKK
jgi:uncharacterized protein